MNTLLQINSVVNTGSTGHIVEDIGKIVLKYGWNSYIAYGRNANKSASHLIRIGNKFDIIIHGIMTRFFDLHGLCSIISTNKLIKQIKLINPSIIHLHNIHGYYLNYKLLFKYLSKSKKKVVWTMHDCWAITGHCAYYLFSSCNRWQKLCFSCPNRKEYPTCSFFSNAKYNYLCKKKYFNLLDKEQLTIVTPSEWLQNEIEKSYLNRYRCITINNGIDITVFTTNISKKIYEDKFIILGVASIWDKRKGLNDFIKLSDLLETDEVIILIGLSQKQIDQLPRNNKIIGIKRTDSQKELANYYANCNVFLNPTYEDNFPTTNLEALACGKPVITYNTGGSPESICNNTGFVVEKGDISSIRRIVNLIKSKNSKDYLESCRYRAELLYDKAKCFEQYIKLYKEIIG